MSAAVGGAGGAGGDGGGGPGKGPNWSKGHGVDSVAGEKGVKKGKTPLYRSGAQSVAANWGSRIDLGEVQQQQSGPLDISLVPSRSNPAEFRAIATKHGGGSAAGGSTSFHMGRDPVALALSGGRAIIDRPDSPPPVAAAAAAAAAAAPAGFMAPVAAPAPVAAAAPAGFMAPVLAQAPVAAAAPAGFAPAVQAPVAAAAPAGFAPAVQAPVARAAAVVPLAPVVAPARAGSGAAAPPGK